MRRFANCFFVEVGVCGAVGMSVVMDSRAFEPQGLFYMSGGCLVLGICRGVSYLKGRAR